MEIELFCSGQGHLVDKVNVLLYPFPIHIEKFIYGKDVLLAVESTQVSEALLATLIS